MERKKSSKMGENEMSFVSSKGLRKIDTLSRESTFVKLFLPSF